MIFFFFFFFQAEDGIRDGTVTGVQTCALPISPPWLRPDYPRRRKFAPSKYVTTPVPWGPPSPHARPPSAAQTPAWPSRRHGPAVPPIRFHTKHAPDPDTSSILSERKPLPRADSSPRCGAPLPSGRRLPRRHSARLWVELSFSALPLRSRDHLPSLSARPPRNSRLRCASILRLHRSLAPTPGKRVSWRARSSRISGARRKGLSPAHNHLRHSGSTLLLFRPAIPSSVSAPRHAPGIPQSTTRNHPSVPGQDVGRGPPSQRAAA